MSDRLSLPKSELRNRAGRIPLKYKITAPYLFLAIILAVSTAILVTRIVFDTIDERYTNSLIEAGMLSSAYMVQEEDRLLEIFRLTAYTKGMAEAIQLRDTQALREKLLGIAANYQVETIEILDAAGLHLFSMRHKAGQSREEYLYAQAGDAVYSQWGFVRQVLTQQADRFGDKYAGYVSLDGEEIFYVAGPVRDSQDNLVGVILVGERLQTLVRGMNEATLARITLYNNYGQPIVTTLSAPVTLGEQGAAAILQNETQLSAKRSLGESREVTSSAIAYEEILSVWEARRETMLGVLGVALPKSFLVDASSATRFQAYLLVAAANLLVILVGFNLSSVITRPLGNLVTASRLVAGGDLDVQVELQTNDEIAILADSFNHMVANLKLSKDALIQAYDSTLEGWSLALELRDKETEGHTRRVTEMTLALARRAGLSEDELQQIKRGAMLHDIGKMGVPDAILQKPGKLTAGEMAEMQKHPLYAFEMLKHIEYLQPALDIPLYHHERWDGQGYPHGLRGETIPLSARIFSVVDVWDAMSSERVYRPAMHHAAILRHIEKSRGTQFDPAVVDLFLDYIQEMPEAPDEGAA